MTIAQQLEKIFSFPFQQQPDILTLRRESHNASYVMNGEKLIALNIRNQPSLSKVVIPEAWKSLEYLNISDNEHLKTLEFETALPDLFHIDLSDNGLEKIALPDGLAKLKKLDISRNALQSIDFQKDLPALERLDLSENKLIELNIPHEFGNLKYLYANKNSLKTFTTKSKFRQLEILHLAENKLIELPRADYPLLGTLYVRGNPLKNHQESLIKGDESGNAIGITGYLRAIKSSGERPNYRIKLIIVGNGRIGKTCLGEPSKRRPMFGESDIHAWNIYRKIGEKAFTSDKNRGVGFENLGFWGARSFLRDSSVFFIKRSDLYLRLDG